MCPAAEKSLSEGAEVAGMHKTAFASLTVLGNLDLTIQEYLFYVHTLFHENMLQYVTGPGKIDHLSANTEFGFFV